MKEMETHTQKEGGSMGGREIGNMREKERKRETEENRRERETHTHRKREGIWE